MRVALLVCAGLPLLAQQAPKPSPYVEVDYAKVERTIAKEPAYVAVPRYALFVLDPAGTFRTWAVVDRSAPDARFYDVLYFDLDGDGDLTESGERFTGVHRPDGAPAGIEMTFKIPEIRVPGSNLVHTKFWLSTAPKKDRSGFWFQMYWGGKTEMSGGYGRTGSNTTAWGTSVAAAPIFRPCPDGVLTFATWSELPELRPGGEGHLNVIVGNPGSGPDTLAVVDENFLDLKRDELLVTVVAQDRDGKPVQATSRIQEHC